MFINSGKAYTAGLLPLPSLSNTINPFSLSLLKRALCPAPLRGRTDY